LDSSKAGAEEVAMQTARSKVVADTDQVRITSWEFAPGTATGLHRHEFPYVVIPVTGGSFRIVSKDGSITEMAQEAGGAYVRDSGAEHDVINSGESFASFVEVELKR
jgi:quercetin dioxygenase-like cupin family protein